MRPLGWETLGLTDDPRQARWEHSQEIDVAELEAFRIAIEAVPAVITIVGDRSAIDAADLKALGTLRVIEPRSLFGYE